LTNKILVVEDEPNLVQLLKAGLEAGHYEVVTAKDGQEALEMTRLEKPDLIILDIMLPKIDGYKVAARLKDDEDLKDIPIVMLTARCLTQDIKKTMENGAVCYVQKPFKSEVLLAIIQGFIYGQK
jgi:DNA-binding response OmpR family regulator